MTDTRLPPDGALEPGGQSPRSAPETVPPATPKGPAGYRDPWQGRVSHLSAEPLWRAQLRDADPLDLVAIAIVFLLVIFA